MHRDAKGTFTKSKTWETFFKNSVEPLSKGNALILVTVSLGYLSHVKLFFVSHDFFRQILHLVEHLVELKVPKKRHKKQHIKI